MGVKYVGTAELKCVVVFYMYIRLQSLERADSMRLHLPL